MAATPQTQIRIPADLKLAVQATYADYGAKTFAEAINGILHVVAHGTNPPNTFDAIRYLRDAESGKFVIEGMRQNRVDATKDELSIFFKYMTANNSYPLQLWRSEIEPSKDDYIRVRDDILNTFDIPLRISEVRKYWDLWLTAADNAGWTRDYLRISIKDDYTLDDMRKAENQLEKKYKEIVVYPPPNPEK